MSNASTSYNSFTTNLAPADEVKNESWAIYSVAILFVALRMIAVWKHTGRLQADDILMLITVFPYTLLIVSSNIIATANTNYLYPGELATLTAQDIRERVYGSKMGFVQEQSMIHTIWFVKICLLLLYNRMSQGLTLNKWVKGVGVYVVISYIIMETLFMGVWCHPITEYWAVPTNNEQCCTYKNHLITQATLNLSSDLMILALPITLVLKGNLTRLQKLGLSSLFSLGIFVILCAVLNKYWDLAFPALPNWLYWYIREGTSAVIVANFLLLRPLLTSVLRFFKLRQQKRWDSSTGTRVSESHGTTRGSGCQTEKSMEKSMEEVASKV